MKPSVASLKMAQQFYNDSFVNSENKVIDFFSEVSDEFNINCVIVNDELNMDLEGEGLQSITIAVQGANLTPQKLIKLFQHLGYDEAMEVQDK